MRAANDIPPRTRINNAYVETSQTNPREQRAPGLEKGERRLLARKRLVEAHRDLLQEFSAGEMPYPEFAARLRRRADGQNEDNDYDREREFPFDDWQ